LVLTPGPWEWQIEDGNGLSFATARADGDDIVVATNVEPGDIHHDAKHRGFKRLCEVFLEHRVPAHGLLRVTVCGGRTSSIMAASRALLIVLAVLRLFLAGFSSGM
jgi:hypothetical protein